MRAMARRRWIHREVPPRSAVAARDPDAAPSSARRPGPGPVGLACSVCLSPARGFGFQPVGTNTPARFFCSLAHQDLWARAWPNRPVQEGDDPMIDMSDVERLAVRHARSNLAEVLVELGLMPHFHDRSAAEIDRIIVAAVEGYRAFMRTVETTARRAADDLNDPIPF